MAKKAAKKRSAKKKTAKKTTKKKTAKKSSAPKQSTPSSSSDNNKLIAILSYFVIGIVWYFVDEQAQKNALVKFHVKQSLNLIVCSLVANIVLTVLVITAILLPIVQLVVLVLWILGIVNAANMDKKPLPIIGNLADRYLKF